MKNRISKDKADENNWRNSYGGSGTKKMKKNKMRLGGKGGLSLEVFANAKTKSDHYNPALISKDIIFSSLKTLYFGVSTILIRKFLL